MAVPVSELQQIAPSAVIELYELQLNTTQHGSDDIYRFHAGTNLNNYGEIIWAGNAYMRFPVEADGFDYNGTGGLPRPKIRCSNILSTITAILATLPNGLEGAKVTRIRTLARYLDSANFPSNINPYGTPDPTAELPREIYYVDRKVVETRDAVEFELAAAFDLAGVRAPKRQCVSNICQWRYRSAECGYTGDAYFDKNDQPVATLSEDVCAKRLSSCELRFSQLLGVGNVTNGSNLLVLDQPLAVESGSPISGFGVPTGTTVKSRSSNIITMSAHATANTTVSKTGTLQTNGTQIILSNVTDIAVSMAISGPKIVTGTTITAISGNTITLGQPVSLIQLLGVVGSRSGILDWQFTEDNITSNFLTVSPGGLSVGMYVTGDGLPADGSAQIVEIYSEGGIEYLWLNYYGPIGSVYSTYTFYSLQAQPTETYSISASRNFLFREEGVLNFGSFPGIGTYYA